jgi:hypothetical protein
MARKKRISACEAKHMLRFLGVNTSADFHALRSRDVDVILQVAKGAGYRKHKSAPGSTARMFFQRVQRARCKGADYDRIVW